MLLFMKVLFTQFIAEMGDKTQLMLVAMTSRFKLKDILLGTGVAVLVLNGPFQHVGQDFHVLVRMGTEALACINHVVIDHPQRREAHKVRVVIVRERESMPGIQPAVVSVAAFVSFA